MLENVHPHQYTPAQLKQLCRERVTKLYLLVLSKLVYSYCSVPCTLALEYCMMLCEMSLDRHLCCQGFFDAFLTVYLGRLKWMKSTRNSLILHKFYKVAFDTSKIACNIMHKNDVYMHIIRRCLHADTCDFRLRTIKIKCFI